MSDKKIDDYQRLIDTLGCPPEKLLMIGKMCIRDRVRGGFSIFRSCLERRQRAVIIQQDKPLLSLVIFHFDGTNNTGGYPFLTKLFILTAVSYTHLDVYKRQYNRFVRCVRPEQQAQPK